MAGREVRRGINKYKLQRDSLQADEGKPLFSELPMYYLEMEQGSQETHLGSQ